MCDDDAALVRSIGFGLIRRDNVGYDFLSYAVGLDAVPFASSWTKLLFCNDSFFVSDEAIFTRTLGRLLESLDGARFLTVSRQIELLGQSFCFAIERRSFERSGLGSFFRSVRPQPGRMDVIYSYELGLSRHILAAGGSISALHHANDSVPYKKEPSNPTHHEADELERLLGVIKFERLVKNPLALANSKRIAQLEERASLEAKAAASRPKTDPPAVVICHCHYPELVSELLDYLDFLPAGAEVHLTSSDLNVLQDFREGWRLRQVRLNALRVENRGRDVGPFIAVVQQLSLNDETPVLKIHGKRSLYSPNGEAWRRDMLNDLLPSEAGVEAVLTTFGSEPRLGMLGPRGSYVSDLSYWGANSSRVKKLVENASGVKPGESDLGFYAGTMFWFRWGALKDVLATASADGFEAEEGQRDGTYAHVLERALPMIARAKGWQLWEANERIDLSPAQARSRRLEYF
jgi:lipopolysaccharide biosynthesis protein